MKFTKAKRKQAKLRLALAAPSGAGKTLGALMIASGLGGRIAVIDSERGSASLYSDPVKLADGSLFTPPEFDTLDLEPPYSPERYIEAIKAAESAGYDVIIIDSTTPEWSGTGGCLEINEHTARAKFQGNTWAAWNDTTPRHRAFIDAMNHSKAHIIATGRSKTETAQTDGPNGKKKVVKLGMKTEQRDGFEYEFTVVLDLIHDGHFASASKDRTGLFIGDPKPITVQTGVALREWLERGDVAREELAGEAMPETRIVDWIATMRDATHKKHLGELMKEAKQACANLQSPLAWERIRAAAMAHGNTLPDDPPTRNAQTKNETHDGPSHAHLNENPYDYDDGHAATCSELE